MKCNEEDEPYSGTVMDATKRKDDLPGLVAIRKVEQHHGQPRLRNQLVILREPDGGRCNPILQTVGIKNPTQKTPVYSPRIEEITKATTTSNLKRRREGETDESRPCKIGGMTEETEIASRIMKTTQAFNNGQQNCTTDIILDHTKLSSEDMVDANSLAGSDLKPLTSANGVVFKLLSGKGQIVVKQFQKTNAEEKCQVDCKEVLVPFGLKHASIVALLGVKCSPTHYSIFMEDGGVSLSEAVFDKQFQSYLESNFMAFCANLYEPIRYLEDKEVAHRDIKPGNLGIFWKNATPQVKLFDFGSAQGRKDEGRWSAHTPEFLPPALVRLIIERRKGNPCEPGDRFFKERADLHGISVSIVWLGLGGRHPIDLVNRYSSDPGKFQEERSVVLEMIRDMPSAFFEPHLLSLEPLRTVLRGTLQLDPDQRWSAKAVCEYLSQPYPDPRRLDFHKTPPPPAIVDPPPPPRPPQVSTEIGPSDSPLMETNRQEEEEEEDLGSMRIRLAGKGGGGGGGGSGDGGGGNTQDSRGFLNNANCFRGGQYLVTGIDSLVQKQWIETCLQNPIGIALGKPVEQQAFQTIGIAPRKPVEQQAFQTIGIAPRKPVEQQAFQTIGIAPRKPVEKQAFQTIGIAPRKPVEKQAFQAIGIAPHKPVEQQAFQAIGIALGKPVEQQAFQTTGVNLGCPPAAIANLWGTMGNRGDTALHQQRGTNTNQVPLGTQCEVEMEMTAGGGGSGGGNLPHLTELMMGADGGRIRNNRGPARGAARRSQAAAIVASTLPTPSPSSQATQLPNLAVFDDTAAAATTNCRSNSQAARKTLKATRRN